MPGNLYLPCLSAGLHLSGANGATSFPDLKGHSFYRTGAVAISTAQSRFAGEGSAYFPGGVDDLIKCDQHADFGDSGASMAISFSMFLFFDVPYAPSSKRAGNSADHGRRE